METMSRREKWRCVLLCIPFVLVMILGYINTHTALPGAVTEFMP